MRVLVCEFVTGGGLYREPIPPSLAREGDLMLRTLLRDLSELAGVELVATRDPRMPSLDAGVEVFPVGEAVWHDWDNAIMGCDALWPIAPESGGILQRLSLLARRHGKLLLGSSPEAVALTASKRHTLELLGRHGIPVVPTYLPDAMPVHASGNWIAKPDDGAGCEDSRMFNARGEMMRWLARQGRMQSHVIQPRIEGDPASISALFHQGQALLLSCNRQQVVWEGGQPVLKGCVLNALDDHRAAFADIAAAIAAVVPGLWGYAGIDLMVEGDRCTVLEINPRLTTSYVGMRAAIGCNPARLVLDMHYNGSIPSSVSLARNIVDIPLNA